MYFSGKVMFLVACLLCADYAFGFVDSHDITPEPSLMDVKMVTVTSFTTRTHTLRKTITSHVFVTSAALVPITVTQYSTRRDFIEENPDTVTSFIRLTATPILVETKTVEKFPVRTALSKKTELRTVTSTIDFWQPITHYETSFEVVRLPIEETQTLIQVVYDTITVTTSFVVTSTHGLYRYGY